MALNKQYYSDILNSDRLFDICYKNYNILLCVIHALRPLLIFLLLPGLIIVLFYLSLLIIYLYRLKDLFLESSNDVNVSSLRWLLCSLWCAKGRILHGYEIEGLEKIPNQGSAYIVYFHGTLPLDIYYFATRFILLRKKIPVPVVDRFLFHVPGFHTLLEFMRCTPGSVEDCAQRLRTTDDVLLLSPGGVREALFSDEYYNILWGKRRGFAKIAIKANKPVYPMFTENIREPVRVVQWGKSFWKRLYDRTRFPIVLFYGYFPCKLRTYIGDPVYPLPNEDVESFADRVQTALADLISQKQMIPGNILVSTLQRIPCIDRWLHSRRAAQCQVPSARLRGDTSAS